MIKIDIQKLKQEIGNKKSHIKSIQKKLAQCSNNDIQYKLEYQLKQEEIKLESLELLLHYYKKVGGM